MRSPYHLQNNNSLVFQFMVSEYLAICQAFKSFEIAVQNNNYEAANMALIRLLGYQDKNLFPAFFGYADKGLLQQLQSSCQSFNLNDEDKKQPAQKLNLHAQKAYSLCYQVWKTVENRPLSPSSPLFELASPYIPKIQNFLNKIGRLIAKLFLQFEDDETILFFLLENHQIVDEVYKAPLVKKVFAKMFPQGLKTAEKYIIKQYSKRGYYHLLPQVLEAAKELQQKK
ncbi:hypothetical protein DB41_GW00070 [Neochlamydia sp. TUME1]|uniref:hypothetical protein n=1 Tax=Neochlamydia sp. TUME1 TaxID=1478174 RepID=UPI00057E0253|nr:hypothetical protein [Neochlamydia sp. TUME1]KIC75935.1 hypothetical protein DB41_GW00070 [Neochlamydia sp. TUME1]